MAASPTFGVLQDFRQALPFDRPYDQYYGECLATVRAAEDLGYSAVWLSEHHFTDDGFLPSPLVMAVAIARETTRIQIGTNILILPLHHPLRVAEDAAVADLLSGGRLVLGVGQGYTPGEIAGYGGGADTAPALERDDFLVGTPEQVADRLRELHRVCGFDHYAFWARLPGLPLEQALASLRVFALQVAPHVRGEIPAR